jgi:hypothetical protein
VKPTCSHILDYSVSKAKGLVVVAMIVKPPSRRPQNWRPFLLLFVATQLCLVFRMKYLLEGANHRKEFGLVEHLKSFRKKQTTLSSDIVFGIPTIARPGNPDYLLRTVRSMRKRGLPLDQLYILQGNDGRNPHPVLENVTREFQANPSGKNKTFSLVPRDETPVDLNYKLTRGDKRVVEAFRDVLPRKQWRIQESHDFMWLMQYMLDHSNASYIGFNQDDSVWVRDLPNLTRALDHDEEHSIISLYGVLSLRHKKCGHEDFCGMVSLIFRRSVLQSFLEWMQPRWKETPIDWTLEDFIDAKNITMTVLPSAKHIGRTSSFDQNTKWGEKGKKKGKKPSEYYAYQMPEITEITHFCDEPTTPHPVVFGIPTLPRFHNPHYLSWTIESMRRNCVSLDQIFVYPLYRKESPVAALLTRVYDGMEDESFHYVPNEKTSHQISIDYNITRPQIPSVVEAAKDGDDWKKWRIQDAHDFRHLAYYMLEHTDSPYIGFHQDDVEWEAGVLLLSALAKNHSILSLHRPSHGDTRNQMQQGVDCNVWGNADCGIMSLIFRRDTLQSFLTWMEPLWKELPLAWTLKDFCSEHGITIATTANGSPTRHIGKPQSLYEEYQDIFT